MDLMSLKALGATAGITAIISCWGQIRGFLLRFRSMFIVTIDIDRNLGDAVFGYMVRNFRRAFTMGEYAYSADDMFVRPKGRRELVSYEKVDGVKTFFNGMFPIFISPRDKDSVGGFVCTFIRGTVKYEDMLKDATDDHNYNLKDINEEDGHSRHYISHKFGRFGGSHSDGDKAEAHLGGDTRIESMKHNMRFLGWDHEDIGELPSKKPFHGLFYPSEVGILAEEINRWHESSDWFKSRGIPWRMGCMLTGKPGTGKSSFVKAIAHKHNLPVHIYDLASMSNEELKSAWKDSLSIAPIVVLLEDLDRVFYDGNTVIDHGMSGGKGKLTLDCLLNCISGVENSDGVLTFVTANNPDHFDEALVRAGRIDRHVVVGLMDDNGLTEMAKMIHGDSGKVEGLVKKGQGMTGAEFQQLCTSTALEDFWGIGGGEKVFPRLVENDQ